MNTLQSEVNLRDQSVVGTFFAAVYKWMTLAMIVSGVVAWYGSQSAQLTNLLITYPLAFWVIFGAELALVWVISSRAQKLAPSVAVGLFMLYSVLSGLTLSMIFIFYPIADIFKAFAAAAGMFAVMSVWGYTTKRDLSGLGSFFFMAIIGIILASVVNFWLQSPMLDWMVSYGGVVVFAGLAAYDHQKLKTWALMGHNSTGLAVQGALTLYLDFINLFLFLLRIFSRR